MSLRLNMEALEKSNKDGGLPSGRNTFRTSRGYGGSVIDVGEIPSPSSPTSARKKPMPGPKSDVFA